MLCGSSPGIHNIPRGCGEGGAFRAPEYAPCEGQQLRPEPLVGARQPLLRGHGGAERWQQPLLLWMFQAALQTCTSNFWSSFRWPPLQRSLKRQTLFWTFVGGFLRRPKGTKLLVLGHPGTVWRKVSPPSFSAKPVSWVSFQNHLAFLTLSYLAA